MMRIGILGIAAVMIMSDGRLMANPGCGSYCGEDCTIFRNPVCFTRRPDPPPPVVVQPLARHPIHIFEIHTPPPVMCECKPCPPIVIRPFIPPVVRTFQVPPPPIKVCTFQPHPPVWCEAKPPAPIKIFHIETPPPLELPPMLRHPPKLCVQPQPPAPHCHDDCFGPNPILPAIPVGTPVKTAYP